MCFCWMSLDNFSNIFSELLVVKQLFKNWFAFAVVSAVLTGPDELCIQTWQEDSVGNVTLIGHNIKTTDRSNDHGRSTMLWWKTLGSVIHLDFLALFQTMFQAQ